LTGLDVLILILYLVFVIGLGFIIRSKNINKPFYKEYFFKGLLVKLIGGISFSMVYTFYYSYGGDTKAYFRDASSLCNIFYDSPLDSFKIFLVQNEGLVGDALYYTRHASFEQSSVEFFVIKILFLVNLISMNNYFSSTIIFSFLSFLGVWKLFLVFATRYPEIKGKIALSVLFVPSVFFWGSGIMKDCIVIGFLGYFIFYIDRILTKKGSNLLNFSLLFLSAYMIYNVKVYVIMSISSSIFLMLAMRTREKISNIYIRFLFLPIALTISFYGIGFVLEEFGKYNPKYRIDNLLNTASGMQTWHGSMGVQGSSEDGRGSTYTLGDYESTFGGVMSKFPASVNVTLFRPYLWETKNVAMIAAAIESTLILGYSIYVFFGLNFFRVIKIIKDDSYILFCLTFAIFFAFFVGFSSYNFGALVRYKTPCIPFYLLALFILQYKANLARKRSNP
jgi:hypothetical protein